MLWEEVCRGSCCRIFYRRVLSPVGGGDVLQIKSESGIATLFLLLILFYGIACGVRGVVQYCTYADDEPVGPP